MESPARRTKKVGRMLDQKLVEIEKLNSSKQSANANKLHRKKHDRTYDCEACYGDRKLSANAAAIANLSCGTYG